LLAVSAKNKLSMDNRTKATVAVVVTPIVILLVFLINKVDSNKCDPVRENTRVGMGRLYSENSIKQIVLKNGREPYDITLDSLIVTDPNTLEEIRNLILNREHIDLNRYSPKWEIEIIVTVDTGIKFKIGLKKSNDADETNTGYKIYFDEECNGNYDHGSKDLGNKITEIIKSGRRANR
jgi:hypothetical protein